MGPSIRELVAIVTAVAAAAARRLPTPVIPGALTGRMLARSEGGDVATAAECAAFCGAYASEARFVFYVGAAAELPSTYHKCTCFAADTWTVLDSSSASGFVHGESTGAADPALAALPAPLEPTASGVWTPQQGAVVPTPTNLSITTAFELTITIETPGVLTPGNLLRVTPRRLDDCRPCVGVTTGGRFQANLLFSEQGWWKYVETTTHAVLPNTQYTLKVTLRDRRLRLFVDLGASVSSSAPHAEANAGLSLSGEYPRSEPCIVYAANDANDQVSNARLLLDTLSIESTIHSHKLFEFDFESGLLKNLVRFHVGFDAPGLTHAADVAAYAVSSPSKAVLVAEAGGTVAKFDHHAALVLQSSADFLPNGDNIGDVTLCLRTKRIGPLDTLFTALAGFGEVFALRYYAYFNDIALATNGHDVRATPSAAAEPSADSWTHVCGSTAAGGRAVLYVNGVRVGSAPAPALASTQLPLSIGAVVDPVVVERTGNRGFGGLIDDVVGWGRQLSDFEVAEVFAS